MLTRRTALTVLTFTIAGCTRTEKPQPPSKRYSLTGEVIRLDEKQQVATIKHENIEGWMEAMTMEFPVRDKTEFAKLSPGKRIRATVVVQELDYWLVDIQPI